MVKYWWYSINHLNRNRPISKRYLKLNHFKLTIMKIMKTKILLLFCFLSLVSLNAQECDFFENQNIGSWTGINATVVDGLDGANGVLSVSDNTNESWVINDTYNSNTVGSSICYSYNLINDGNANVVSPLTTQIYLTNNNNDPNGGLFARFILTTAIDETDGWQDFIVPINTIANGTPLPGNNLGQWQMNNPTQWNTLVTSYTGVAFFVDVAGSPAQTENFLIDNFCTNNTLDADFIIEPGCINGSYFVDLSVLEDQNANYTWTLYQTTEPNATTGGQLVGTIQNGGAAVSIGDLDVTNYYYVELSAQGNECAAPAFSVQAIPFYEVTSDFVLINEAGEVDNVFCYSEDIILDGSNSVGEDQFKYYIKRRPSPNPNNQDWSQYESYGWINSEADARNITSIFANLDYYFLPGYEYSISLAVQNTSECVNWVTSEQSFTIECCDNIVPDLNADFDFVTNCENFLNYIVAIVLEDEQPFTSYNWTIMQTDVPDVITGGTLVASGSGTEFEYFDMEIENFYYIQLTAIDEICQNSVSSAQVIPYYPIESIFHFEDESGILNKKFCYGEDVFLNGLASYGENNTHITLYRRPYPANGLEYSYYGTIDWSGAPAGIVNLSEEFANMGIYFEPGYSYGVKLAVQNTSECVNWVTSNKSFLVTCCGNNFSAEFDLDPSPIDDSDLYSLTALNVNQFPYIPVEHEWTLISTPDINDGPFTFVLTSTDDDFYVEVEQDLCYIVLHTFKTSCGEYCYGQNVCINIENDSEDQFANQQEIGVIDCDFIDEICFQPANLKVKCDNFPFPILTLLWNEVESADEYNIQIRFNDPKCCNTKLKPQLYEYISNTNSLDLLSLPIPESWDCFRWRVKSNCSEENSGWSDDLCFTPCVTNRSVKNNQNTKAEVFPNPTYDDVRLRFNNEFTGNIQLINLKGETLISQQYQNVENIEISLMDQTPGVYIILVNDDNGSHPYRVVKY